MLSSQASGPADDVRVGARKVSNELQVWGEDWPNSKLKQVSTYNRDSLLKDTLAFTSDSHSLNWYIYQKYSWILNFILRFNYLEKRKSKSLGGPIGSAKSLLFEESSDT